MYMCVCLCVFIFTTCRNVGGLLEFTDNQCCVVEDGDTAVAGYVVTCPDVRQYYTWFNETWLPSLRDKCPKPSTCDSDSKVWSGVLCLSSAPCGLRGCKNRPAPFPGRMSYKATKPGLVCLSYLSMLYYCIVVY